MSDFQKNAHLIHVNILILIENQLEGFESIIRSTSVFIRVNIFILIENQSLDFESISSSSSIAIMKVGIEILVVNRCKHLRYFKSPKLHFVYKSLLSVSI